MHLGGWNCMEWPVPLSSYERISQLWIISKKIRTISKEMRVGPPPPPTLNAPTQESPYMKDFLFFRYIYWEMIESYEASNNNFEKRFLFLWKYTVIWFFFFFIRTDQQSISSVPKLWEESYLFIKTISHKINVSKIIHNLGPASQRCVQGHLWRIQADYPSWGRQRSL